MNIKFFHHNKVYSVHDILNGCYGCSEFSFVELARCLCNLFDVHFYDQAKVNKEHSHISFLPSKKFLSDLQSNDNIVISRSHEYILNTIQLHENINIYNIVHDHVHQKNNVVKLLEKIPKYHAIFVSEAQLKAYGLSQHPRCHRIYNLVKNFTPTNTEKKRQITYASAPRKGLGKIIDLLQPILSNNLELHICLPKYAIKDFDDKSKKHIHFHGSLNFEEYSALISESMYVIAPPSFETYGCVFAEAVKLNTNTLYFNTSGAVKESSPGGINLGNIKNKDKIRNEIVKHIDNLQLPQINQESDRNYIIKQWSKLIGENYVSY